MKIHGAIHAETTFALVPEIATQVGYVVEGWTYIERVLRDILIGATAGVPDEDLIASQLFHIGDLRSEIKFVRAALKSRRPSPAEPVLEWLRRTEALLDHRNTIIHGWYLGDDGRRGVALYHFAPVKKGDGGPSQQTLDELTSHRKQITEADIFLAGHLAALSALILEGSAFSPSGTCL